MGTWEGHISPGVAFYTFGIVFCVQNSWLYLTKGRKFHQNRKSNSVLGKCFAKIKKFRLDSFMKILYGFGAAMAELFYPPGTNKLVFVHNGRWIHVNEWQHFTMYSFFMLSGIIDIISQMCLKKRFLILEKASVAIAFYVTGFLLFYHKHGKSELGVQAHTLLFYANLGMCICLTLEVWRPFDQKLVWLHTLLVMQMGSWLFHLAFILFGDRVGGEKWDGEDMLNLMVLPIFYGWHIFFNCCVMGILHTLTWIYYRRKLSSSYCRLEDNEMQCCMASRDDEDSDSTNGGTFQKGESYRNMNGGLRDIGAEEETALMT